MMWVIMPHKEMTGMFFSKKGETKTTFTIKIFIVVMFYMYLKDMFRVNFRT